LEWWDWFDAGNLNGGEKTSEDYGKKEIPGEEEESMRSQSGRLANIGEKRLVLVGKTGGKFFVQEDSKSKEMGRRVLKVVGRTERELNTLVG